MRHYKRLIYMNGETQETRKHRLLQPVRPIWLVAGLRVNPRVSRRSCAEGAFAVQIQRGYTPWDATVVRVHRGALHDDGDHQGTQHGRLGGHWRAHGGAHGGAHGRGSTEGTVSHLAGSVVHPVRKFGGRGGMKKIKKETRLPAWRHVLRGWTKFGCWRWRKRKSVDAFCQGCRLQGPVQPVFFVLPGTTVNVI